MINVLCGTDKKYRVTFPDADKSLSDRCFKRAEALYGYPLPDMVREHLDLELSAIAEYGHASQYLIGATIAGESLKRGAPITTRGMIGSAIVSYLCGISKVNPLPAHRYCPKCHYFEVVATENGAMSYDLADKACPRCGEVLISDGADIYPEILMGIRLDHEPDIIFNVPAEVRQELVEYIKETFGEDNVFRAGVKVECEDGSTRRNVHPGGIFIIPDGVDIMKFTSLREEIPKDGINLRVTEEDYHELNGSFKKYDIMALKELSLLRRVESVTGFASNQIKTNNRELIDVFLAEGLLFLPKSLYYSGPECITPKAIETVQPESFSDLVRITAMMHGVGAWDNNGEILIREGKTLHELISSRDDIVQYLISIGVDWQSSFKIMNCVGKGKGLTDEMKRDMDCLGVPDWYIESCDKIKYLFPKAHAIDYMLLYWKLAYYKRYFPKEYNEIVKKM